MARKIPIALALAGALLLAAAPAQAGAALAPNSLFCLHEGDTGDLGEWTRCVHVEWPNYDLMVLSTNRATGFLHVKLSRVIQSRERVAHVKSICGNQVTGFFDCTRIEFVPGPPIAQREDIDGWVRAVDVRGR
jgi:hypothetical protein